MKATDIQFHRYDQDVALSRLSSILRTQLPHSNSIYNMMKAPINLPSRHCLFAATFEPTSSPEDDEVYTIIFADRSRQLESQLWIFNNLTTKTTLSLTEQALLSEHANSAIRYIKGLQIPEAPGWPFSPLLRVASLHSHITELLVKTCAPTDAMPYNTTWNTWHIHLSGLKEATTEKQGGRALPDGLTVSRVPTDQVDIVVSTSSIPRQPATLLLQPSVGILTEQGALVAWGYVGLDGCFATLYVIPEYRGKGLAKYVAVELLERLGRGEYKDLGFDGDSGWSLSDVYDGNKGSEAVMRSLGAEIGWISHYVRIDSEKFPDV